ncbi:hypothetical protein SAMN05216207_107118 [Pseudonocardia ammonioxydans]|uniref:MFS transporter n=1 Tax=Pseudonocardia ammonioxydans TaxID=260086 RepID=A0A1I5HQH4_PSUAM|nr:hypothetical protein SAMN05216207_107118 [Pseudonocardia ammonioxydans]
MTVVTRYPRQVLGSIVAVVGPLFTQNLLVLFSPTYATSLGHDRSQVLTAITVSNALMIFVLIGAQGPGKVVR